MISSTKNTTNFKFYEEYYFHKNLSNFAQTKAKLATLANSIWQLWSLEIEILATFINKLYDKIPKIENILKNLQPSDIIPIFHEQKPSWQPWCQCQKRETLFIREGGEKAGPRAREEEMRI